MRVCWRPSWSAVGSTARPKRMDNVAERGRDADQDRGRPRWATGSPEREDSELARDPPVLAHEGARFHVPSLHCESRSLEHPSNLTSVERADRYTEDLGIESARCARATPHEPEGCRHDLIEGSHGREREPACRMSAPARRLG